MNYRLIPTIIIATLYFYACNQSPKQGESPVKVMDSLTPVTANHNADSAKAIARATDTACRVSELDLPFSTASEITYCVDQLNGTIEIRQSGVCKQVIIDGDVRRWTVITDASGQKHFKDFPSSANFDGNFPTIYNPFDGHACDLAFSSSSSGSCPYILIGTDDIRNDAIDKCEQYSYKIYNSGTSVTNYIDIKITNYLDGGVTKYKAVIKQARQTSTLKPISCSGSPCTKNLCEDDVNNSVPCP